MNRGGGSYCAMGLCRNYYRKTKFDRENRVSFHSSLKFKPKPKIGGIANAKERPTVGKLENNDEKVENKHEKIENKDDKIESKDDKIEINASQTEDKTENITSLVPEVKPVENIDLKKLEPVVQEVVVQERNLNIPEKNVVQEVPRIERCVTPENVPSPCKTATPKAVRNLAFKPKLSTIERHDRTKLTASTYGKMSNEAKQQMMKKFGTLTPDRSNLTMLDLIYFNPKDNPMKSKPDKNIKRENQILNEAIQEEIVDDDGLDAPPVPQLKITPDGNVVIAPESLVMKKNPFVETRAIVGEDEYTKKKITRTNPDRLKWTFEETVNFYKALNTIGSDFETMKTIFPDRSRKSLKCKFKREERINGRLIDKMLGTQYAKFDLEKLKKELAVGSEFHKKINNIRDKKVDQKQVSVLKTIIGDTDKDSKKKKKKRNKKFFGSLEIDDDENVVEYNISVPDRPERPKRQRKLISNDLLTPSSSDSECEILPVRKKPRVSRDVQRLYCNIEKTPESDENESIASEGPNLFENPGENIVFNTNININGVKYTKSITFNPDNLENPVDVNETIAHCEDEINSSELKEIENNIDSVCREYFPNAPNELDFIS